MTRAGFIFRAWRAPLTRPAETLRLGPPEDVSDFPSKLIESSAALARVPLSIVEGHLSVVIDARNRLRSVADPSARRTSVDRVSVIVTHWVPPTSRGERVDFDRRAWTRLDRGTRERRWPSAPPSRVHRNQWHRYPSRKQRVAVASIHTVRSGRWHQWRHERPGSSGSIIDTRHPRPSRCPGGSAFAHSIPVVA